MKHPITDSYKKVVFNKEPNEPLTPGDEECWDSIQDWMQPPTGTIDINDPMFLPAFHFVLHLENRSEIAWEEFERKRLKKMKKRRRKTKRKRK